MKTKIFIPMLLVVFLVGALVGAKFIKLKEKAEDSEYKGTLSLIFTLQKAHFDTYGEFYEKQSELEKDLKFSSQDKELKLIYSVDNGEDLLNLIPECLKPYLEKKSFRVLLVHSGRNEVWSIDENKKIIRSSYGD